MQLNACMNCADEAEKSSELSPALCPSPGLGSPCPWGASALRLAGARALRADQSANLTLYWISTGRRRAGQLQRQQSGGGSAWQRRCAGGGEMSRSPWMWATGAGNPVFHRDLSVQQAISNSAPILAVINNQWTTQAAWRPSDLPAKQVDPWQCRHRRQQLQCVQKPLLQHHRHPEKPEDHGPGRAECLSGRSCSEQSCHDHQWQRL